MTLAAALASGLDGIRQQIEPLPTVCGDIYKTQGVLRVPRSLHEATEVFAASEFARQAFGPEIVEHYAHFYRTEQRAYDQAVTDWERLRYFERI